MFLLLYEFVCVVKEAYDVCASVVICLSEIIAIEYMLFEYFYLDRNVGGFKLKKLSIGCISELCKLSIIQPDLES